MPSHRHVRLDPRLISAGPISALLLSIFLVWLDAGGNRHRNAPLLTRGDFPAFYAAAKILERGEERRLYDFELQREIENDYWPDLGGKFYAFAYPPYVALVHLPLAYLSPWVAKGLYAALMTLSLLLAISFAGLTVPAIRRDLFLSFSVSLFFAPVLNGVLAGQNVAVSMLLYALMLVSIGRLTGRKAEVLAGFFLGLWMFKPHYGALGLFFFFLARRWYVLIGALVPFALYYALGALVLGASWPLAWKEVVEAFLKEDLLVNGHQMVSIYGVSSALSRFLRMNFDSSLDVVTGLGYGVSLFLAFIVGVVFVRAGNRMRDGDGLSTLLEPCFLIGPSLILLSAHTLFYDLGLCLFSLARLGDARNYLQTRYVGLLLVLSFLAVLFKHKLFLQPLFLLPVLCIVIELFVLRYNWKETGREKIPVLPIV